MVKTIHFVTVTCLLTLGCDRQIESDIQEVAEEVDAVIARLGEPNVQNPWAKYDEMVKTVTNRAIRAQCYALRRAKLLAVDLNGEDYKRSMRIFDVVSLTALPNSCVKNGRWTFSDEYEAALSQLSWIRRQLDKWKSMVGIQADSMRERNPKKFAEWRGVYRYCLKRYESHLYMLENKFFDDRKFYNPCEDEYTETKEKVEAFLGHPIRSRDTLRSAWKQHKASDEMKNLN